MATPVSDSRPGGRGSSGKRPMRSNGTVDNKHEPSHNLKHNQDNLQYCEHNFQSDNTKKRTDQEKNDLEHSAISFSHSNMDRGGEEGGSTYICAASGTGPGGLYLNKNFDIHLAEIDMETFTKKDIEKLNSYNNLMEDSNDTLRIVNSLNLNNVLPDQLSIPSDACEALSVDSLDLSLEDEEAEEEINSKLIEKCSKKCKARYQIAMIESSTHSMLQNSYSSQTSECDFNSNLSNNQSPSRIHARSAREQNDRIGELLKLSLETNVYNNEAVESGAGTNVAALQSPGSLMKLFMQTKAISSSGNRVNGDGQHKCDNNYTTLINRHDETTTNTASPNTIDSAELPLHVLDLSKKLRQMNLSKQVYSTSMSSNTSYTSTTTTSSSSLFEQQQQHKHHRTSRLRSNGSTTNPFLGYRDDNSNNKPAKSVCTQFPEKFQDKQVQACFDNRVGGKEGGDAPPVLVYYPNYSLPDLSFLQDVFRQDQRGVNHQPIYLSPVKHDPATICEEEPSTEPICGPDTVSRRSRPQRSLANETPKSRPKSYTDYETLLYQDFSHIKDWDSLNLLLPEDFKEFIERNNLATPKGSHHRQQQQQPSFAIKTSIPALPGGRIPGVRLRSHAHRVSEPDKRYSLQEPSAGVQGDTMMACMGDYPANYYPRYAHEMAARGALNEEPGGAFMTRSQTMPNCGLQYVQFHQQMAAPATPHGSAFYCMPPPPPSSSAGSHHACCCRSHHSPHQYCHSSCHSPSMHSSSHTTVSPLKPSGSNGNNPNFNWDLFSSSTSFKRLMSLLNKLDEFSQASNEEEKTLVDGTMSGDSSATMPVTSSNKGPSKPLTSEKHRQARTYSSNRAHRLVSQNCKESTNVQAQSKPTPPPLPAREGTKVTTAAWNNRRSSAQSKATSPTGVPRSFPPPPPLPARSTASRRSNQEKTRVILKRPAPPAKTSLANGGANVSSSSTSHRITSRIPVPRLAGGSRAGHNDAGNTRF